jgi:predicted secreted protein
MSLAFRGQGTQLTINGNAVAELTKVSRGGVKADFADVTNFQSTGGYREVLPTLLDPGEVSFDANYLGNQDPTQSALQTQFDSQALGACQIILPGGNGTWTFNAYVSSLDFDLTNDKEAKLSGKLKITGQPTFA